MSGEEKRCPFAEDMEKSLLELKVTVSQLKDVTQHLDKRSKATQVQADVTRAKLDVDRAWLKGLFTAKAIILGVMAWVLMDRDADIKAMSAALNTQGQVLASHTAILEQHAITLKQQTDLLLEMLRKTNVTR